MDDVKRLCDRLEASAIVASPLGRAAMREAATALTLAQARIRELETALAARSAEPVALEALMDKIEGLESDLTSAVEVAYRRGAVEWVRLNYPRAYAVLSAHPKEAPDV